MPNHVTSIVEITCKYNEDESNYDEQHAKINKLYKKLKKNGGFDFNAVIKTPKEIFQGSLRQKERDKYGENNWYDWNTKNWGTKWNAYEVHYLNNSYDDDTEVFDILVKFDTAWSIPAPIFEKLSEDFNVQVTWKDEMDDEWTGWEKF